MDGSCEPGLWLSLLLDVESDDPLDAVVLECDAMLQDHVRKPLVNVDIDFHTWQPVK